MTGMGLNTGTVAIVTARSGSKSLLRKNVLPLGGKPLMSWVIRAAKMAKKVDRVIVSTDTEEYAKIARTYGAETPFLRPKALAEDVPSELVLIHAVEWLEEHNYPVDTAVLIQPTTPLILPEHIDACVTALEQFPVDMAMTVTEASENPEWMFTRSKEGMLYPWARQEIIYGEAGVRQTLPQKYRPNGGAYAVDRDFLLHEKRLYSKRIYGVTMPRDRSIDVDTELDFAILEKLIEGRCWKCWRGVKKDEGDMCTECWMEANKEYRWFTMKEGY